MYRPTCHYAYHPCDDTVLSMHELAGKNWRWPGQAHRDGRDVTDGIDELGALLMGHAKGAYWYGSQLSIHEARKLAPYNNATSLQVAAGVLGAVVWAMENPRAGISIRTTSIFSACSRSPIRISARWSALYTDWTPLMDVTIRSPRMSILTIRGSSRIFGWCDAGIQEAALVKNILIFALGGLLGEQADSRSGYSSIRTFSSPTSSALSGSRDPASRKVLARGTFIHANPVDPIHYGRGRVTVYEGVLHLEGDFEVGPGPKFHVYLVPERNVIPSTKVAQTMYVDLGRLKAFKGSQNYPIPAGVTPANYGSVVIWCEQFGVLISPAELKTGS